MPVAREILAIGSTVFADEIRGQLTPRSRYRVHYTEQVTIGTFAEHRHPDLAVIDGDVLPDGGAEAIRELKRYAKKFPIVLIYDSLPPEPNAAQGATLLLPRADVSGQLGNIVGLLLYSFQNQPLLQTKSAPLGIINARARPGEHLAVLLHDDHDLTNVARFWTAADAEDAFLLIGTRSAIRSYEQRFALEGLDFRRLKKEERLTIAEADVLNIAVIEKIAREVTNASERGAKLLRIIGTLPGWTQKKNSQSAIWEHVWNVVIAGLPAILLCPYRVNHFDAGSLATQALETHRLVISRNRLFRNSLDLLE